MLARRRAIAAAAPGRASSRSRSTSSSACVGDDGEAEATTPAVTTAPKPTILRILFPEGFTRKEMVKRVAEVRQIAKTKRKVTPKLSGNTYAVATKAAKVPAPFRKHARGIEGFLFPATYEFTPKTTAKQLVEDQIEHFNDELGEGRPAVREDEAADAIRRPDHRLDGREGDDRARRAAARGGRDLQPAEGADAARDRRNDPLRARRPRHRGAARLAARERQSRTTPGTARACRRLRSRTRASPRCRPPLTRPRSSTSTSCASPTACTTSSRPASRSSSRRPASTATAAAER